MRYEPTLIVTRLVVQRGQHTAYDEAFHEGVNVIRVRIRPANQPY